MATRAMMAYIMAPPHGIMAPIWLWLRRDGGAESKKPHPLVLAAARRIPWGMNAELPDRTTRSLV